MDYVIGDVLVENQKENESSFERIYKDYENILKTFYLREEGESLLEKISRIKGRSSYLYRKHELVEKLKNAGINADEGMDEKELKSCVHELPKEVDMEKRMVEMLHRIYTEFETPQKHIEKLVRKLGNEKYKDCPVRLAILKQFLLNTDYHTGPVKEMIRSRIHTETGELLSRRANNPQAMADWADDSLFNILKNPLSKNEKKKYHLLRMCDDLAAGHFKTNGNTRKALYMFAFAFEMKSYAGLSDENYNPELDIERQLFFEYYSNYMMRFLTLDAKEIKSDYEAEPSGEGINYKNYAEVIYLYYLNKEGLTPRDRLNAAERTISECEEEYKNKNTIERVTGRQDSTCDYYTYIFRDYFLEVISQMKEDEIKKFIVSHYICKEKDPSRSNILISSETVTAIYRYRALSKKKGREHDAKHRDIDTLLEFANELGEEFKRLLLRMGDMLHAQRNPNVMKITRTELIAAFYEVCRTRTDQEGMSLIDLFRDCEMKLSPILVESRFQPLREGNIFDVFMVMMLYRYLNIV